MELLEKEQEITKESPKTDFENIKYKVKLGMLSDIPGYGKTLSMIGLIVRNKMEWDIYQPYEKIEMQSICAGEITARRTSRFGRLDCTLILVPPTVLQQWQFELSKTKLRVKTITKRSHCTELDMKQTDVVLVIPSMYNSLVESKDNYAWKRFILDDPNNIKVKKMRKITAGFYWMITSSPSDIRRFYGWPGSGFMNKLFLDTPALSFIYDKLIIENDPDFVRSSFCMPPTIFISHPCFIPVLNTIGDFASENITRMIEAGDIAGAIKSLGGKITDNLVDVLVEGKQGEIETLKKRYKDRPSEPCGICLEQIDTTVLEPNCQNLFCGKCLFRWLKLNRTCPTCRTEVDSSTLVCLSTDSSETETPTRRSIKSKNDTIVDIINSKPDGKFIIFSDGDWSFTQLENFLIVNGISHIQPKGSATTIGRSLDQFRQGAIKVLLLDSQYNGAGMNLQEATDIIFYHEMNEVLNAVVIGRANRIGRTQSLIVHQLVI
jgi:SNF2 family DNA or RNA helicase